MKKILTLACIISSSLFTQAQWLADGTVLSGTFDMTDINGATHNAFSITSQGHHIVIDFSTTWCGPCWSYHNTKVLADYHKSHDKAVGTKLKDAFVVLYEVDKSTGMAELQGNSPNSKGDWITGTPYAICNPSNPSSVLSKFSQPGTTSFGVPAVFVVCNNNKLYKISTNLTTEAGLRSYIENKCGLKPASAGEVLDLDFSYELYPNPSTDAFTLGLNLDNASDVSYTLRNTLGQVLKSQSKQNMNSGPHKITVNTTDLASGIYVLELKVNQRIVKARVMVSR